MLLVAILAPCWASNTAAPKFDLTVESIMRGSALVGHPPRSLAWSADGAWLKFAWARADGTADPAYKDYYVRRDGSGLTQTKPEGFTPAVEPSFPPPTIPTKPPVSEVYVSENDIFIRDLATKTARRLTNTSAVEENPRLVLDKTAVLYTQENKLFRLTVADGKVTELADIKSDPYPESAKTAEDALAAEQKELFKEYPPSGRSVSTTRSRPRRSGGFDLTPDGRYAISVLVQSAPEARVADVPNYITRSGYSELIPTYPKVGYAESLSETRLVEIATGKVIDLATPRSGRLDGLEWSPDRKFAIATGDSIDHKDRWYYGFNPATGTVTTLYTEHNDAWIGGPGDGTFGWFPDSSRFYFQSENTGFAHLLTGTPDGNIKALTSGNYEISNVRLDWARRRFLFVSSEGSPFRRHVDALDLEGGKATVLAQLSADDESAYAIAPDGTEVAVIKSRANRPAELFINGKQVTVTPTAEWLAGPWTEPPVVMVKARDGVMVPAHLYRPARPVKGGPAVVFIHGAGYLQNVYEGWSYYYREYMFHHLLASKGYTVIDIDYRGSAGYGSKWRTAVYRHMGGKDLDDAVDAAKFLTTQYNVDPRRIGIYGGSYGGFITLMAMFTAPNTFAAGAALRPVSDWANYNHGYTSPILNNPQDDPVAYRQSSPIYFADGLKGALLICHGMVDLNVHYQDTVRLIQRLIDLGKTNWTAAPYPTEDHSFVRAASWTDEYRRILDLFERNIGSGYRKK